MRGLDPHLTRDAEENVVALQGFKWSLGMVSKQLARPQTRINMDCVD